MTEIAREISFEARKKVMCHDNYYSSKLFFIPPNKTIRLFESLSLCPSPDQIMAFYHESKHVDERLKMTLHRPIKQH